VTQHGPDREPGRAPQVYLIADDLTGAADSAVTFAKYGARVAVSWPPSDGLPTEALEDLDVVAVTTESRHIPRPEAVRRVTAAAQSVGASGSPGWVYKKVDSTLRGHPGAELSALMAALASKGPGFSRALVAPALPSQRRVTRNGVHFVDGVPLAETVFGSEVGSSSVADLFAVEEVGLLSLMVLRRGMAVADSEVSSSTVVVADAETDADLAAVVDLARAAGTRLLCGSAGLADALAASLSEVWYPTESGISTLGTVDAGVLVIAGSRHPRTLRQIDTLAGAGVQIVCPDAVWFEAGATDCGDVVDALVTALDDGGIAVVTTAGLPLLSVSGMQMASRLAETAGMLLDRRPLGGLILTGGDTAIAVCRELRATALRLAGEVERGVPWGGLVGGRWDGLPVVTKAGGFGDTDTLMRTVRFIEGLEGAV